ncbi:MAG: hypothetical protein RL363_698, partial [Bacteroidota bacterium]
MSPKYYFFYFTILLSFISPAISAQGVTEFQKDYQHTIQPTTSKINIDGVLDEPI